MTRYVQWTFQSEKPQHIEIIIALLTDLPFSAFEEIDDSTLSATLSEHEANKILETDLNKMLKGFGRIVKKEIISEENWNEVWESNFDPVEIDNICRISAPFHPDKSGYDYYIHISPKMAFGTGHHATTRMMVKLMDTIDFHEKHVFDFGTGTGVLAILALKMGAKRVEATDIEPWALENCKENAELNNIATIYISDKAPQKLIQSGEGFDIILANIQLDVLTQNGNFLYELLNPKGILLISGVLEHNQPYLEEFYRNIGLVAVKTITEQNWICQLYSKHPL
jgi:ribosomal protein L11 methyltransferase